jgi:hypothetical protein
MKWTVIFCILRVLAIKYQRWQRLLIRLFVGDGEHTGTGAAEVTGTPPPDFTKIRTRRDLAIIINEATDPVAVKQEILEQQQTEPMEYDNEENFLEILGERGQDPRQVWGQLRYHVNPQLWLVFSRMYLVLFFLSESYGKNCHILC